MTETLQSDWALEMAKSVTVEMIKSTKTTPARDKHKPSPSTPPRTKGNSNPQDAGDEEVPVGGGDASFGSGSSAPDDRPGALVGELEEGELRSAVGSESESSR